MGPEGTGIGPAPPCEGGVRGACCLWAVRASPVIPVSWSRVVFPGVLGVFQGAPGLRGRGALVAGWAFGWPRGVCELDSGCEHLDLMIWQGPWGFCLFGLVFCCSALILIVVLGV